MKSKLVIDFLNSKIDYKIDNNIVLVNGLRGFF
jgi:hypothetical protein